MTSLSSILLFGQFITANRVDQKTDTILTNEMILNDPQLKFRAQ